MNLSISLHKENTKIPKYRYAVMTLTGPQVHPDDVIRAATSLGFGLCDASVRFVLDRDASRANGSSPSPRRGSNEALPNGGRSRAWAAVAEGNKEKYDNGRSGTWRPGGKRGADPGSDLAKFVKRWPGVLGSPKWKTPEHIVRRAVEEMALRPGETMYDLGCGDGRVLIAAALAQPSARCVGYDIDETVCAAARAAAARAGVSARVDVRCESAYTADLSEAAAIYCFSNRRGLFQLLPLLRRCSAAAGNRVFLTYLTDVRGGLPGAERRAQWCLDPDNALSKTPLYRYTWR
jgi:SAM-dependent methyltransferase